MANQKENQMNGLEIAIVGMAGRFPGARTVDEFWQNLRNGVESISCFSNSELEAIGVDSAVLQDPNYVKARGVLPDIDLFDATFFGYTPRDAAILNPQQRIFLECAWEACEQAGYNPETYGGLMGVYAGSGMNNYLIHLLTQPPSDAIDPFHAAIGNDKDFLATRVSYKLNLRGPSYTVQTACSTSLVAVHLACQGLLSGECDLALAGGIAIALPQAGYWYQAGGIRSADGHCRAFDASAQGTVSGSGVGIVVLKRLEDALADRDCIHAVIKGSAVNNDGADKVSYTAPRIDGQAEVIQAAQAIAEVGPASITYIEAHGTGTALGDPVEIAALTQAFRHRTPQKQFCAIGSVKTNIGHLDTAAGIAGLIKTVLALKHRQIPPSLHFQQPNPQIDFADSPFYVNTQLLDWQTDQLPRRAGVSSFGMGGTNVHVVLEEAPTPSKVDAPIQSRSWQLLLLSAKTESALEAATHQLVRHCQQHPDLDFADLAYTLHVGRHGLDYRRVLVAHDRTDALHALATLDPQRVLTQRRSFDHPAVVFLFPGQGSQYVNMGRELYETEPIVREWIDRCCELLIPHLGLDLRQILYPANSAEADAAAQKLNQTAIAQPALFVLEYALAQLWMAWGVRPQALMGHSIGEYVAACLAGVFTLEDALALVALRGQLMQSVPPGAMLSVSLSAQEISEWLHHVNSSNLIHSQLSLAAINSPLSCVVSGTIEAIEIFHQQLIQKDISCRRLHTSHAYHSSMMDAILKTFIEKVEQIDRQPPQLPFISNLTGTWITATAATDPHYWANHLRRTVQCSAGLTELLQHPDRILLEVGPGRTLTTFAKRQRSPQLFTVNSLRHPQETQSDVAVLLNAVGQLWLAGVSIDGSAFYAQQQRRRIPLPTYPFERQRYWIDAPTPAATSFHSHSAVQLKKNPTLTDWFYSPSWKRTALPGARSFTTLPQNRWLLFVDDCGIGLELANQLQQQDQAVITVAIGDQFAQINDTHYVLNPQRREDYDALLHQLQIRQQLPDRVLHLWGVTVHQFPFPSGMPWFTTCQERGFYSLLFLVQAIGNHTIDLPIQITLIANHLHDVTGEAICPEKVPVLGLCHGISQEYFNLTCRAIDIGVTPLKAEYKKLVSQLLVDLLNELLTESEANTFDRIIAYRGNYRWIQTFESLKPIAVSDTRRLRQGGVYLITGGLGDVGKQFAEHLAKTVQAKLILVGRSAFPLRDRWQSWLATHPASDPTTRQIQWVQSLEALGAEVLVVAADVTHLEQMQAAIALARQHYGTLHGVIHTAGVRSINTIQEISRSECEQQFAPKVQGLYVLANVLQNNSIQNEPIDFCVLTSSLASVLGVLGAAAYPAAHLFMDAFAQQLQTPSSPWISINWDNWFTQTTNGSNPSINAAKETELGMTVSEGMTAFEQILAMGDLPQVIVSTGDLHARLQHWTQRNSRRSLPSPQPQPNHSQSDHTQSDQSQSNSTFSLHARPSLQTAYVAPRTDIERTMTEIWQQLLGITPIGIQDNFFELGGDSILGIQFISRANRAGLQLVPKQVFQHQTIAELAQVAGSSISSQSEQGLVTGTVPLTPIQHWFFEQQFAEPHQWNESIVLEALQPIDSERLEQAIQHLLHHHDALRSQFICSESGWQQITAATVQAVSLLRCDLSVLSPDRQAQAMQTTAAAWCTSLNLAESPLQVGLFQLGANQPDRLLIVIHHLVVDVVSWHILIEDLQTVYRQLSQGEVVQLPAKTTAFKQWAEHLQTYAQSATIQREQAYWLSLVKSHAGNPEHLPVDLKDTSGKGVNSVASARTIQGCLSVEETRVLLQEIPAKHRLQIEEVLLTAIVQAITRWAGTQSLWLDLEGQGRDVLVDSMDLSRTVGCFTALAPVRLDLGTSADLGAQLQGIKDQLRRFPNGGIGYGVLRYLSRDRTVAEALRQIPTAQVAFLYLGQLEQSLPQSDLFRSTRELSGLERHPDVQRSHLLNISGFIADQQLHLKWTYSQSVHHPSTIAALIEDCLTALRSLITYCQSTSVSQPTATDFPAAQISQTDFEKLLQHVNHVTGGGYEHRKS
jgi:non-ribosomal peptide synthase protein (TIGR01720 family)